MTDAMNPFIFQGTLHDFWCQVAIVVCLRTIADAYEHIEDLETQLYDSSPKTDEGPMK
jgi:hypothetical protein